LTLACAGLVEPKEITKIYVWRWNFIRKTFCSISSRFDAVYFWILCRSGKSRKIH